jgi:hypothetical protein
MRKPKFVVNDETVRSAIWQIYVVSSVVPDEIPLECN